MDKLLGLELISENVYKLQLELVEGKRSIEACSGKGASRFHVQVKLNVCTEPLAIACKSAPQLPDISKEAQWTHASPGT
jgi:hypothetical protein